MSDLIQRLKELEREEYCIANDCDCASEDTANYQNALTCKDAVERIEELQRQNAMLLHAIYPMEESARQIFETHGYSEMANWAARLQAARCATSAQSAAWLEASHIEWMKGLPVVLHVTSYMANEYAIPEDTPLYAIPIKKD